MAVGRDLVREWLFEYGCRHYMPAVLREISLHHSSVWTEELWSIPPILPMMAAVNDVIENRDEESYSYVLDVVTELYERTTCVVDYGLYAKLSVALKILVLFRMLRNSDKLVLQRLNVYFPRSGFHNPNVDENLEKHLNHLQLQFRKFFLQIFVNKSAQKVYLERDFEKEYGDVFMLRLTELVRRFLSAIETILPQPVIEIILASEPDSDLLQELTSTNSPSIEILLDATQGCDRLTEAQVLEVLQNLRVDDLSIQTDRFVGLGLNLLMSPTGEEPNSALKTGDVSKRGVASNRRQSGKADEKFEDRIPSAKRSRATEEQGTDGSFLPPRKKASIMRGDSGLVEEGESSSDSQMLEGRIDELQRAGCAGESQDFVGAKSTGSRNVNRDGGDIRRSKPTNVENNRRLSIDEESTDREWLGGEGDVNFRASDATNRPRTRPSSSEAFGRFRRGPATLRCTVAADQQSQPSVTAFGMEDGACGAKCERNRKGCAVTDKEDGLGREEDLEPTEELKRDSSRHCGPFSLEAGKEHAGSSESSSIPDTPLCRQGTSSLPRDTAEGFGEEDVMDDQSCVTDSEDLQSFASAQDEIVPSSYSFDKFDLVVREGLPTVALPSLQNYVRSSLPLCVVKLFENHEFDYISIDGKRLKIFL